MTTAWLVPHHWVRTRDLLRELIARDIKLRYRGSALGILWTLLNPLAELLVLSLVFGVILRVDIPNFAAYLFTGLMVYGWFQTSVNFATEAVVGNRELVRRPNVPILVLPVVTAASNLFHFLLSMPILLALLFSNHIAIGWSILALPVLIAIEFVLILAFAYPVATINVWFRDTQHVLRIALQLLFFLTPIVYDVGSVPAGLQWLYRVNPMAHLVDAYRAILLRDTLPPAASLVYLSVFALAFCSVGMYWFYRASPRFPDEL